MATPFSNAVLKLLTAEVIDSLQLQRMEFPVGLTIYEANLPIEYVYFPEKGVLSVVSHLEEGRNIEVETIGHESMAGSFSVTRANADAELDIWEYQVGLQMEFPLRFVPATAFFRTALEYQQWDVDAPSTGGAGFGGTIGEITTNSFASAGIGGAELVGLALGCGFTW